MIQKIFLALLCMTVTLPIAMADIYKCTSEDGVFTFSDTPCVKNSELFLEQSPIGVDEALAVELDPFIPPYTTESYNDYIIGQAERIGRCILPDQFLNSSEGIRIYPEPCSGTKNFKVFSTTPGWKVSLFYGPQNNPNQWKIAFYFVDLVEKDIDGVTSMVVKLRSIAVEKDKSPIIPTTMENLTWLTQTETGRWEAR